MSPSTRRISGFLIILRYNVENKCGFLLSSSVTVEFYDVVDSAILFYQNYVLGACSNSLKF